MLKKKEPFYVRVVAWVIDFFANWAMEALLSAIVAAACGFYLAC